MQIFETLKKSVLVLVFGSCFTVLGGPAAAQLTGPVGPGTYAASACNTGPLDQQLASSVATTIPRYWPLPNQLVAKTDKRCSGGACSLQGWLYQPAAPPTGSGKFPAVVHMHGHGSSPGEACAMIKYYTDLGYIVFAPVLRGAHDQQNTFSNTGLYIDDYGTGATDDIDYLHQEVAEVQAALTYLTTYSVGGVKPVDPAKIALTGHSFGGSLVIFAAAASLNPRPAATVDLSGATKSWGSSPAWKNAYQTDAALHQMPIRFQQTTNETSAPVKTDPTTVPFMAANGSGTGEAEMAIYSAVPGAADNDEAHSKFMTDTDQVARWVPAVVAFIKRRGVW